MEKLRKNKIIYISICCLVIIGCIIMCYKIDKNNKPNYDYLDIQENIELEKENSTMNIAENKVKIFVYVTGEVKSPGVINVFEGQRIKDVIEKAGGITELADIKNINLAYQVSDGQQINIPNIKDKENNQITNSNYIINESGENVVVDENKVKNNKININKATQSELETLTGIGPSIASKIIEYRNKNGKFKDIKEIKNVTGVGESKYKNIEDKIII